MKTKMIILAAVLASTMAAATITAAPAVARDGFALSFEVGNVRFGYADGYYDH